MDKKFYNKVIKLIPSDTLKEFLKTSKFKFKEKDLLVIINDYSRNFNEKIQLLEEAINCIEDKDVVFHAKKLIQSHSDNYDCFMRPSDDCVYEINIITDDDFPEDRQFVAKTFQDALTLIKLYNKEYEDGYVPNSKAGTLIGGKYVYYKIFKSTAIAPKKPSDIHNKVGRRGECLLGKRLEIIDVNMYDYGDRDLYNCKNKDCDECKNKCIFMHNIKFPAFLQQYQLVAFKHYRICYGVMLYKMQDNDNDSYIIFLDDNDFIANRKKLQGKDDYRIIEAHCHPSYCEIYKPNREDVPDDIYENYLFAVKIFKELGFDGKIYCGFDD